MSSSICLDSKVTAPTFGDAKPKAGVPSSWATGYDDTVIIFDWDDTLLASSLLANSGYRVDVPYTYDARLEESASVVCRTLEMALQLGRVVIITNAEQGWVEMSCKRFLPSVQPLLANIKVVSARTTYEPEFPRSPIDWKVQAFNQVMQEYFPTQKYGVNVLSFGDSQVERNAVHVAARHFQFAKGKSIKFVEKPSIRQINNQLEMVMGNLQQLVHYDNDLDLLLSFPDEDENAPAPSASQSPNAATQRASATAGAVRHC